MPSQVSVAELSGVHAHSVPAPATASHAQDAGQSPVVVHAREHLPDARHRDELQSALRAHGAPTSPDTGPLLPPPLLLLDPGSPLLLPPPWFVLEHAARMLIVNPTANRLRRLVMLMVTSVTGSRWRQ